MYYTRHESKIAPIILVGDENGLTHLYFDIPEAKYPLDIMDEWEENDDHFAGVIKEIDEYFVGKRKKFTVKLNPSGTDYQKKVWDSLCDIAYGKTVSYKDIAANIGNPNASRAVGNANGKNPIPLIVPCHRVVGADNKLTGFAFGTDLKKKLIDFEKGNV